jgi:hypothetical protein
VDNIDNERISNDVKRVGLSSIDRSSTIPPEYTTCDAMFETDMCPHYKKPAVNGNAGYNDFAAKFAARTHAFVKAHQTCHQTMKTVHEMRFKAGTSKGEAVKYEWIMAPYFYSQVVFRGEKANPAKIDKIQEKRKATLNEKRQQREEAAARVQQEKEAQQEREREEARDKAHKEQKKENKKKRKRERENMQVDYVRERQILGLSPDAELTRASVRSAWKAKALLLHPDKHPVEKQEAAKEKFQELQRAYEVLKDLY